MLNIDSGALLRIAIFSGFVGFVIFCGSYAIHVWLKRNKGNQSDTPWVTRLGMILATVGLIGAGGIWALIHFVDRSGIVDGDALFVVHARRDGNVTMITRQTVSLGDIVAEFHPPAMDTQLKVIDSQINEAQARIEALQARQLEVDSVLNQRQEQIRGQIDQHQQQRYEFMRARRELDRERMDAATLRDKERNQIGNDVAVNIIALDGLPPQLKIAANQLDRATELRMKSLTPVQVVDDRTTAMLKLAQTRRRLETTIAGLGKRLTLLDNQEKLTTATFDDQVAAIDQNAAVTEQTLSSLETEAENLGRQIDTDRTRAATLKTLGIEVARRQVDTLTAERSRTIAAQQILAPFTGRVVYRNDSPGLQQDDAPVLAVSAGAGFEARISMPDSEIGSVAGAGTVRFALEHPVLKKYFSGTFRGADEASLEPGRAVVAFDAQLPPDAIGLLGNGREPVKVHLLWQPPLLEDLRFRGSLSLLVVGLLLIVFDRLRRPIGSSGESFQTASPVLSTVSPVLSTVSAALSTASPHQESHATARFSFVEERPAQSPTNKLSRSGSPAYTPGNAPNQRILSRRGDEDRAIRAPSVKLQRSDTTGLKSATEIYQTFRSRQLEKV